MRNRPLILTLTFALLSVAATAQTDTQQVRRSDLTNRTFLVRDLKITLKRFWGGSLLSRGYMELRVENGSAAAATFNPQRLSFVGKDGKQVNIRGRRQTGPVHPDDRAIEVALPREVAGGAYLKELYELDGRVHLPAKLIYEGEELAVIIK